MSGGSNSLSMSGCGCVNERERGREWRIWGYTRICMNEWVEMWR